MFGSLISRFRIGNPRLADGFDANCQARRRPVLDLAYDLEDGGELNSCSPWRSIRRSPPSGPGSSPCSSRRRPGLPARPGRPRSRGGGARSRARTACDQQHHRGDADGHDQAGDDRGGGRVEVASPGEQALDRRPRCSKAPAMMAPTRARGGTLAVGPGEEEPARDRDQQGTTTPTVSSVGVSDGGHPGQHWTLVSAGVRHLAERPDDRRAPRRLDAALCSATRVTSSAGRSRAPRYMSSARRAARSAGTWTGRGASARRRAAGQPPPRPTAAAGPRLGGREQHGDDLFRVLPPGRTADSTSRAAGRHARAGPDHEARSEIEKDSPAGGQPVI